MVFTKTEPTIGQAIYGFDHLGLEHLGNYEGQGKMSFGINKEMVEIIEWEPSETAFAD